MVDSEEINKDSSAGQVRSWYEDRYQALVVQRNLFLLIIIACAVTILVAVVVIGIVSEKKVIEPMVIEVEDKSGITNIVNPDTNRAWTVDETLNKYFLITYLRARETYNISDYTHNFNTVVRLMSSTQVYAQFGDLLSNPATNPSMKYGANESTKLEIRSILFLGEQAGGQSAQIRFVIVSSAGQQQAKIVSLIWNYVTMQLTFDERMVNPLGFQIQSYSIADDTNV